MFKRSFGSKDRVSKIGKLPKRSIRDNVSLKQKMLDSLDSPTSTGTGSPTLNSAIVTIVVGRDQRLFAAHEDALCHSPYLAAALRSQFFATDGARIDLPNEEAEIFSCVLEYLYQGDYSPRLLHDKRRNTWMLDTHTQNNTITNNKIGGNSNGAAVSSVQPTIFHAGIGEHILRDTAVYCAADRYGLDDLKRLALRKQGLQTGVEVGVILRSARYAYENTPDSDSRLRAHYLALIIRCRRTFKRSGTMQVEMESGGKMFFDLFVAMCNHMDDIAEANPSMSPRTI